MLLLTTKQMSFGLFLYIRICNMRRVRDRYIPDGLLCQSGKEAAMVQKF